MAILLLLLTFLQDSPQYPEFRRAHMAQQLKDIRADFDRDERNFFLRSIRPPGEDPREAETFVRNLETHPVEDALPRLEDLQAATEAEGYLSIAAQVAVERILLRGRYVSANTDVSFVSPLLDVLVTDYLGSPALMPLVKEHETLAWMIGDEKTENFLRVCEEQSPHPSVRARAALNGIRRRIAAWHEENPLTEVAKKTEAEIEQSLTAITERFPLSEDADLASFELYAFRHLRVGGKPEPYAQEFQDYREFRVSLGDYQFFEGEDGFNRVGQVVLLEFWAQWCGPSAKRFEQTKELIQKFRGRPLVVVSINNDSREFDLRGALEEADIETLMEQAGIIWHHVQDGSPHGVVAREWGVSRWPSNFIIDHRGMIQDRNTWGEDLLASLEKELFQCEEAIFVQRHRNIENESSARFWGKNENFGDSPVYSTLPVDPTPPLPGIIVLPEAFGLTPTVKLWTDRLATLGYAAVAIDPFEGKTARTTEEAAAMREEVSREEWISEINNAIEAVQGDEDTRSPSLFLVSWGAGAGAALEVARSQEEIDGSIIFGSEFQDNIEGLIAYQNKPVLMIVGNRDQVWSQSIMSTAQALASEDRRSKIFLNQEVGARFFAPAVQSENSNDYSPEAALEAWAMITEFLRSHTLTR